MSPYDPPPPPHPYKHQHDAQEDARSASTRKNTSGRRCLPHRGRSPEAFLDVQVVPLVLGAVHPVPLADVVRSVRGFVKKDSRHPIAVPLLSKKETEKEKNEKKKKDKKTTINMSP